MSKFDWHDLSPIFWNPRILNLNFELTLESTAALQHAKRRHFYSKHGSSPLPPYEKSRKNSKILSPIFVSLTGSNNQLRIPQWKGGYIFEYIFNIFPSSMLCMKLKFIYSEKATKFCEISTNYLTGSKYIGQIIGGDFAKFCGLLGIYELEKTFLISLIFLAKNIFFVYFLIINMLRLCNLTYLGCIILQGIGIY